MFRPDKIRGFTLIEILMVVVILGIAAAAIVPQIGSRDDLKASAAARSLMADLIYAQNRAITTQKMIYATFDETSQAYELLSNISPKTDLTHPLNKTDYVVRFGASGTNGLGDARLVSANFDGEKTIGFDEMGAPYAVSMASGSVIQLMAGAIDIKAGTAPTLRVSIEPYTAELTVTTLP